MLLRAASAWRYHSGFYRFPLELRALHRLLAYQRPETGLLMIPTFARLNSRIGRNAAVKLGSEVAGRAASLALLLLAARVSVRPPWPLLTMASPSASS